MTWLWTLGSDANTLRELRKRLLFITIMAGIVLFLLPRSASAATYYLDPVNGNDLNAGVSTADAWRTIEYALESGSVAQGDTLYLMAGTHNQFKSGTDNWINPSIAAGDGSGVVHFRPRPGDEGNVTISMPATTSTSIGWLRDVPGITFSWTGVTFLNDSGGSPVAADWFYVRGGTLRFTNVVIDNNNLASNAVFNYKVTAGGVVEITRSTIQNVDAYLVFHSVGGTFTMRSSVLRDSDNGILYLAGAAASPNVTIEMVNNTLYNIGSLFAFSAGLNSLTFVNNIVHFSVLTASVFNTNSTLEQWASTNVGAGFVFTHNILWYANITSMGVQPGWNSIVFNSAGSYLVKLDKTNRLVDPGFNNAPSDLSIAPSSHILGLGNNAELPGSDINGSGWAGSDIGAYAMPSSDMYQYSLIDGKVAFLGDSIFGCAGTYFGADENCVYRQFETLTGLTAVDSYVGSGTYKAAISGGRVEIGPWLADYIVDHHRPKVVFLSLGINNVYDTDSTGDNKPSNVAYQQIADVVETTMEKLDDYGVVPIWMGVLSNKDGQVEADAINDAVELYCTANGWTCGSSLDQMRLSSSWQTDYYDDNGLGGLANNAHPDKDGHELMARLAQDLYTEAMENAAPSVSDISAASESALSVPTGASCSNTRPGSAPDLFQIDRSGRNVRLYFAPAAQPYNKYIVAYGAGDSTEQFGVQFDQGYSSGVIDYIINELDPGTGYSFKVQAANGCATGGWSNVLKVGAVRSAKQSYYRIGGSSVGSGNMPLVSAPRIGKAISTPEPTSSPVNKNVDESPRANPDSNPAVPSPQPTPTKKFGGLWQWFLDLFK